MMKQYLFPFAVLYLSMTVEAIAQDRFITSGLIEYEKSVNVFALMRKSINVMDNDNALVMRREYDNYQRSFPQFRITKFSLTFSINKALYVPAENVETKPLNWYVELPMATQVNTVYTDFSAAVSASQKEILGNTFLVKDSLKMIHWKITDETRTIAGYICRRANALVLDSVYAVAFYTDKIAVSSGPESFRGLPGMILGVALPYENTTWFATKVDLISKPISPSVKGKIVNEKEFRNMIRPLLFNLRAFSMSWKAFLL